ncbi:MAG TPA: type II secretion system protein N [Leucothrix sp.]|nr:type II secretion system protein N [Leucothrix sp.]
MKKIIFFGLISFLFAAIWQLPLPFAKPYIEKLTKQIKMTDVSGTIWNAEAKQLTINNTRIDNVKWKVRPLHSLTTLSLNTSFKIQDKNLTANGIARITPQKKLILDDTKFTLDASYLNTLQNNAKLTGDIIGNIKHAVLDQKDLPEINGVINWNAAAITSPIKVPQGDYHALITPDKDGLHIKLTSSEAPAELNGSIKLNKEWFYDADISIKAKDKGLGSILGLVGKKQPDGSVKIKQKGDLKPFLK